MKILVTYGGMQEPIDGVRKITNTSSGNTGRTIVEHLVEQGHDVTVFRNKQSLLHRCNANSFVYESFADLEQLINNKFNTSFNAVIHLSAISDYCVKSISINGVEQSLCSKLESGRDISVHLTPTNKLIDHYKKISPDHFLVGFKLTNNSDDKQALAKVRSLFDHSYADVVVHNDLSEIKGNQHLTTIYNKDLEVISKQDTNDTLAQSLSSVLINGVKR